MNFNTDVNRNFFYCREDDCKKYLMDRGFRYLCNGLNIETKQPFYLFQRTNELNETIKNYLNNK